VRAPVWIPPGHPTTRHRDLGYGRRRTGRVGSGRPASTPTPPAPERGAPGGAPASPRPARARHQLGLDPSSTSPWRGATSSAAPLTTTAVIRPSRPAGSRRPRRRLPAMALTGPRWGMAIRTSTPHRLRGLRAVPARREQHPRGRQGQSRRGREMHCLRNPITTTAAASRTPKGTFQPVPCHALRRTPREWVARWRPRCTAPRPQRWSNNRCGRHALLLHNCPLRCAVQPSCSTATGPPTIMMQKTRGHACAAAASWRSAPTACSASPRPRPRRRGGPARPRRRGPDRVPGGVSDEAIVSATSTTASSPA